MLLADIRDGLAEVLSDGLPSVNVYRLPTDRVEAPAVCVMGFRMDPQTMAAAPLQRVTTDLLVLVSRRHIDQVDLLDALVDPALSDSVPAALAADFTLGGRVDSCIVTGVGDYGEVPVGDVGYYAATITVEVMG
jgi:hypothetical protein